MARRLALCLAVSLLFYVCPVLATHGNITGVSSATLFSSQQCNPTNTVTSSAFTALGTSENQSVFYTVSGTGGSPNLAIVVLGSHDNVTYAEPTVGATPRTVTANESGLVPLAIPFSPYLKIRLVNASSTVTATCTLTIMSQ